MKILVFSDSHGNSLRIKKAISDHEAGCNLIIHLGDGRADMEYVSQFYPEIPCIMISGNSESRKRDEKIVEIGGIKIICIHGHTFNVKKDINEAQLYAKNAGADILLYGHTHFADDTLSCFDDGRRIRSFNPGSIGKGYPPSYGIIIIPKDGIALTSHVYL